jgi:hypothetical protein
MTELTPPQPSDSPERNLHFIFWRHVPGNVPAVLEELEDAEVLLLESSPAQPKRAKIVKEALMNYLLDAPLTRRQTTVLAYEGIDPNASYATYRQLEEVTLAKAFEPLEHCILERYHSTGKLVRFMDSNPKDQPEIAEETEHMIQLATETNDMIRTRQLTSLEAIQARYFGFLAAFAKTIRGRDVVTGEQLVKQQETFPNRRLAVVYGPGHTAISHPWLHRGLATRVFIDSVPNPAGLKQSYGLDGEAIRRLMYEKPMPEDLIIRCLLKNSMVARLAEQRGRVLRPEVADLWIYEDETYDLELLTTARARAATAAELAVYSTVLDAGLRNPTDESAARLDQFLERL